MRVFVAGATGVVGRPAVWQMVAAGHEVTAVARRPEAAQVLRDVGATPITVDLFDVAAVTATVAGHDAVVNLATHIPAPSRMGLRSAWGENDRLRSVASRVLVDAALAGGVGRVVQESVVFVYPDRGADWIDEATPTDPADVAATALEAEAQAARCGAGVALRFGQFYGDDGAVTGMLLAAARRGLGLALGAAEGFISSIHVEDAAAAVVAALQIPAGVYNVVDDEPMTRRDVAVALAAALGAPSPRLLPGWASRVRTLEGPRRSLRISAAKLRATGAWQPRYPSVREGWRALVAART